LQSTGLALLFGLVIIPAMDKSGSRYSVLPSWPLLVQDIFWGFITFFALIGLVGIILLWLIGWLERFTAVGRSGELKKCFTSWIV
jgi:hypothetical protein